MHRTAFLTVLLAAGGFVVLPMPKRTTFCLNQSPPSPPKMTFQRGTAVWHKRTNACCLFRRRWQRHGAVRPEICFQPCGPEGSGQGVYFRPGVQVSSKERLGRRQLCERRSYRACSRLVVRAKGAHSCFVRSVAQSPFFFCVWLRFVTLSSVVSGTIKFEEHVSVGCSMYLFVFPSMASASNIR